MKSCLVAVWLVLFANLNAVLSADPVAVPGRQTKSIEGWTVLVSDELLEKDKAATKRAPRATAGKAIIEPASTAAPSGRKLSFKEQRELQALPALVAALELEQAAIAGELADGSLYRRDAERASELGARNARIEEELLEALERWEILGTS